MEQNGIIEKVTKPTDWVNPVVIVPKKNNSIRICLDPRHLNKVIKRHHYQIPSQDQLLAKQKGSRVFSLLDAKNAFYHMQLDDQSLDLCTFITPFGSETLNDHYEKVKTVFEVARKNGLNINKDKLQIAVPELQYLGHIVSSSGLSPDKKKVQAIADFPAPTNKQELMRFLGMATYLMKFVPRFSQETSTLRNLLKNDASWIWDAQAEKSFDRVKQLLQSTPVLKFFDKDKPIVLSVDASSFGLGLIHKPFETISPRLQRLLLRLQRYSFTQVHVPGKQLAVADALSRAPLTANPVITNDIDNTQLMVSVVVQASQSKIAELKQATQNPEMKAVQQYIQEGWPKDRQSVSVLAKPYWNLQSELHIEDGLICRGQRLVIPRACRKEILQRIHVGHRGIVSCKNLARQSLYWPGLSSEVEMMVTNCQICQPHQKQNIKEQLLDRPIPDRPWQRVAIDFFHLSSVTYMLVIDYFSKYIEVQHFHNTTSQSVINALKICFARFGIPEEIVADNGPPFDSSEFNKFCKDSDIFFYPSSPG
ncbi:hypothetical protein JTE90_020365, partial [Oedothorax gibbosus]